MSDNKAFNNSAKLCDQAIRVAGKMTGKLQDAIQHAATLIVIHATTYGDVTKAQKLIDAVANGKNSIVRRDALVRWFVDQGCMRIKETKDADGKTIKTFGLDNEKQAKLKSELENKGLAKFATDMKAGPSWHDAKKEQAPFEGVNIIAMMQAAIAKADKVLKDEAKSKHPKNNFEGLDQLRGLVATLKTSKGQSETVAA